MKTTLLLVGCGRMGSALLGGWCASKDISATVVEPHGEFPKFPAQFHRDFSSLDKIKFDAVVVAVKPKDLKTALQQALPFIDKDTLVISIAAGKTTASIREFVREAHIVRVMPNLPALINKGISALYALNETPAEKKSLAEKLLKAVGETCWIENEKLMNPVTALSGSGPAYLFLIADELAKAAAEHGLPEGLAKSLALHTLKGAAEMALDSSHSLKELAEQVTSPGGTTEAAIKELVKDNRLKDMLSSAIKSATRRAIELENG